eukprot:m.41044 g.41044  ORF g.41044 m.41044 type:complete len:841 (-) comp6974_c0_seq1:45-2567(-)
MCDDCEMNHSDGRGCQLIPLDGRFLSVVVVVLMIALPVCVSNVEGFAKRPSKLFYEGCVGSTYPVCQSCVPPTCVKITPPNRGMVTVPSPEECCALCTSTFGCTSWMVVDDSQQRACSMFNGTTQFVVNPKSKCIFGSVVPSNMTHVLRVSESTLLHKSPPSLSGCHIDLGYDNQLYSISSQLLYAESFENHLMPNKGSSNALVNTSYWNATNPSTIEFSYDLPFNGFQSARIQPNQIMANRGFHSIGLHVLPSATYDGFIMVRVQTKASMVPSSESFGTLVVGLRDYFSEGSEATIFASQAFPIGKIKSDGSSSNSSTSWLKLPFSLKTKHLNNKRKNMIQGNDKNKTMALTSCRSFPFDTPPLNCQPGLEGRPGHVCLQCSGEFFIQFQHEGGKSSVTIDIDMPFLELRTNLTAAGIHVKEDTVQFLQKMNVDGIRFGGTFVETDISYHNFSQFGYNWETLHAPFEQRWPLVQNGSGIDENIWGLQLRSSAFGPFEFLNFTNYMGWDGSIALNHQQSISSLATLVDYMFATSGSQAQQRAQDGFPHAFDHSNIFFELGNEIYNPSFASQVAAMEERAIENGIRGNLNYACPWQCLSNNGSILNTTSFGQQIVFDCHTHDEIAYSTLKQASSYLKDLGSDARFSVWETNTMDLHNMMRALLEAMDDNVNMMEASNMRLASRTASFCMEMSAHDPFWSVGRGDQGLIFYTQNQTWGQPPFHARAMLGEALLDTIVSTSLNNGEAFLNVVASISRDGGDALLGIRIVNTSPSKYSLDILTEDAYSHATVSTLVSPNGYLNATNPFTDPNFISPSSSTIPASSDATPIIIDPFSLTTILFYK